MGEHIIHPEDVAHVRTETDLAVMSGAPGTHYEYRVHHKNGGWLWVSDKNKIVRDAAGKPQHIIGLIVDISERKRTEEALREREEQLRLVTDAMPALVSYIDSERHYRLVNRAYSEWFGYASEDILDKTMSEVLGEAAFERLRPHVEAALSGKTETFETQVPYKLGGTRFIYAIYTPDLNGERVKGFFVHVLDISERKASENALREANEQLRLLSDRQKRFVAHAAHELRAPLTAIQGNLQLMTHYQVDPEMQQEMLGDVRLESERLARLVNDLLAIARGDSGLTLEKTPLQLDEVLLEAWRSATLLTSQHELSLGHLDSIEITGNRDRLKQLLLILLENAIKYTPPGGRITMRLEHDAAFLRLCVRDSGIGIDAEDLPHVFERFYRADKARTRAADPTGTGLGLSIAEWIVAQHDGKIWLESTPGKGTTAWVQLPISNIRSIAS